MAVPPVALTKGFEAVVALLVAGMIVNMSESNTLATVPDVLLTTFISGELRAGDVEAGIKATV